MYSKKIVFITLLLVSRVLVTTFAIFALSTQFVKETPQDIEEAIANIPERVPTGNEVFTKAGQQLSPGSVPQDFRINKEIYNDLATIQAAMTELMQLVLNIGIKPTTLPDVQTKMKQVISLIARAGIRYNHETDFSETIKQLRQIMAEIESAPRTADFMLFKVRLEVILAEVENTLLLKLAK